MTLPLRMALLARRQQQWRQTLSHYSYVNVRYVSNEQGAGDTSRQVAMQHTPNTLWELVTSMSSALSATGPALSLGELLWGTQVLAAQHAQATRSPDDELQGRRVNDEQLLQQLVEAVDFAAAAYKRDKYVAAATCRLKVHDIVVWQGSSKGYLAPGYFIGIDHVGQEVVWSIRGTSRLLDLVTDLTTAHPSLAGDAQTHWGMHQAARYLLSQESTTIKGLLDSLPTYRLHIVGHSMGGGVAALLAYMAHTEQHAWHALMPSNRRHTLKIQVHATCIAPPCIMTKDLANRCRPCIRSLILGDDLVPRLNSETASALMTELRATDWRPQVASLLGLQPILDQYKQVSASVQENLSLPPTLTYDVAVAEKLADLRDSLARGMWGTAGAEAVKAKIQELAKQVSESWQDSRFSSGERHVDRRQQQDADNFQELDSAEQGHAVSDPEQQEARVFKVPSTQVDDSAGKQGKKGSDLVVGVGSSEIGSGWNAGDWFDERKWGELWRQGVQATSQQLEAWQHVLPVTARQALLRALSLPRASDPLSLLKLLPIGAASRESAEVHEHDTSGRGGKNFRDRHDSSSSSYRCDGSRNNSRDKLDSSSSGDKRNSSGSEARVQLPAPAAVKSRVAKAAVESTGGAVVSSMGIGSNTQTAAVAAAAAETTSQPHSMPTLYPAGQLYYIRKLDVPAVARDMKSSDQQSDAVGASALDDDEISGEKSEDEAAAVTVGPPLSSSASTGTGPAIPTAMAPPQVEVLQVPPDAKFFGRILLVRRAVQDHRNRAYRSALYAVLGRPLIRT